MGAGVASLPLLPFGMTEKSCKAGKQMPGEGGGTKTERVCGPNCCCHCLSLEAPPLAMSKHFPHSISTDRYKLPFIADCFHLQAQTWRQIYP